MNTHCLYCGRTVKSSQEIARTNGWRWYHRACKAVQR